MTTLTKPLSKTQLLQTIADGCDRSKQDVADMYCAMSSVIELELQNAGTITLPGLLKIEKKDIPAKEARTQVPNPFKPGELMDVAAKPASTKIKVRPLKNLRDMA